MNNVRRSYFYLHIAVFLWGFTAVLGDLITLSAGVLVWWRVAITSLSLLFWPGLIQEIKGLSQALIKKYILIGFLVALHWLCFFGSVKFANASIALITFSTTAFFTSFLEPMVFKTKVRIMDIGISLLVIPAMALIVSDFESGNIVGFWLGILSAFLCAYFSVLNRQFITNASPQAITFIEMFSSWLFLSLLLPITFFLKGDLQLIPDRIDLILLVVLAVGCTILPFILHLLSLRYISAFASNLVVNLEPLYGIILAIIILKEYKELNIQFYIGLTIILLSLMVYPVLIRKRA